MHPHIIRAALALIVGLLLLPLLAMAQPAPAASAPRAITYNSPCGAPGYGKQWVAANGRAKDEPHARDGVPGKHVNAAGYWSTCTMPPPPRDCPERPAPDWRGKHGHYCAPVPGRMIPGRDAPFGHDVGTSKGSRNKGISHWRCEKWPDGKTEWREVRSSCEPR